MSNNISLLGDAHVDEWFSRERAQSLEENISPSIRLLRLGNILDSALRTWSELQILDEIISSKQLAALLNLDVDITEEIKHNPQNFKKYRKKVILVWSMHHWENKIESIYLQKSASLQRLSFKLINVDSSGLAYEIYYRLKAGEESFDQLYLKYDISTEKSCFGNYKNKPLSLFPQAMHSSLHALTAGELLQPFANGKQFSVLIMEERQPAIFDDLTKEVLFYDEFAEWQNTLLLHLKNQLLISPQEV